MARPAYNPRRRGRAILVLDGPPAQLQGSFRYPGKLLVIASVGLCGLAGLGWDDLMSRQSNLAARLASLVLLASLLMGGFLALPWPAILSSPS